MNAAQRRHYDAIQQLARDEWPFEEPLPEDNADDLHAGAQEATR